MMNQRDPDHIVELAAQNICNGVIEEPRVFYDNVTLLGNGLISKGDPNVFINGEQFPVRVTEIAFGLRPNFGAGTGLDERALNDIGARFVFHDSYYQSPTFLPIPVWANKVTAGPRGLSSSFSAMTFDRPAILSARDTFRVAIALEEAVTPPETKRATVVFHGLGVQTKTPYILGSYKELQSTVPTVLSGAEFRNDGAEPIAITDMNVALSASTNDALGAGDVRRMRVNVQQIGNGTGANWFLGPTTPTPLPTCPGQMLGFTQGRVVVHRIPGEGWLWEPGEGVTLEAIALANAAVGFNLAVSVRGYISLV